MNIRKLHEVMRATIRSYDRLIAAPRKELPQWKRWGNFDACRLCKFFKVHNKSKFVADCKACPLCRRRFTGLVPCVDRTFSALRNLLHPDDGNFVLETDSEPNYLGIVRAAKERRKWIMRMFNKNYPEWNKKA